MNLGTNHSLIAGNTDKAASSLLNLRTQIAAEASFGKDKQKFELPPVEEKQEIAETAPVETDAAEIKAEPEENSDKTEQASTTPLATKNDWLINTMLGNVQVPDAAASPEVKAVALALQNFIVNENSTAHSGAFAATADAANTVSIFGLNAASKSALTTNNGGQPAQAGQQAAAGLQIGVEGLENATATEQNIIANLVQKGSAKQISLQGEAKSPAPAADALPLTSPLAAGAPPIEDRSIRLMRQIDTGAKPATDAALGVKAESPQANQTQILPQLIQQAQQPAPANFSEAAAQINLTPAATAPAAEQVAFHIGKSAKSGTDRIRINLTPEDLGRVEIKLDMHKDGQIKAVIAADKPETMEWLMRDAKQLERALQDAGFKTDSNSLQFQQRDASAGQQNSFAQLAQERQDQNNHYRAQSKPLYNDANTIMADQVIVKNISHNSGVNILV